MVIVSKWQVLSFRRGNTRRVCSCWAYQGPVGEVWGRLRHTAAADASDAASCPS